MSHFLSTGVKQRIDQITLHKEIRNKELEIPHARATICPTRTYFGNSTISSDMGIQDTAQAVNADRLAEGALLTVRVAKRQSKLCLTSIPGLGNFHDQRCRFVL